MKTNYIEELENLEQLDEIVLVEYYAYEYNKVTHEVFQEMTLREALQFNKEAEIGENSFTLTVHRLSDFKGLMIDIYEPKNIGNCSNNGVSETETKLFLVGDDVPQLFQPQSFSQIVYVDYVEFKGEKHPHLKPFKLKNKHSMFGGCFGYTSDSRFPNESPLKIHDRVE